MSHVVLHVGKQQHHSFFSEGVCIILAHAIASIFIWAVRVVNDDLRRIPTAPASTGECRRAPQTILKVKYYSNVV